MRILLVWTALCYAALPTGIAATVDAPSIEVSYSLHLSTGMKAALAKHDSRFKIWTAADFSPALLRLYRFNSFEPWRNFVSYQAPSALLGDFNGDNKPDAVLMGRNEADENVLVILSREPGYEVIALWKNRPVRVAPSGGREEYLALVPPRNINPAPSYNRASFKLATDAIEIGVFERGSKIFVYEHGRFQSYSESDD